MSKNYILKWSGGEINISSLGCMMVPKFKLDDKYVVPLHWKTQYSFFVEKI